MNKKFSTLIAAFLAAGSFMSVEAGVVRITTPVNGHQYVIANHDWANATVGSWIISDVLNSAVKASAQANTATDPTITPAGYWTVGVSTPAIPNPATQKAYTFSQVISGANVVIGTNMSGNALQMAVNNPVTMTQAASDGALVAPGAAALQLKFTTGATVSDVTLEATGTPVAFYVLTTPIAKNAVPQNLMIGDKYLVIDPTNSAKPILVDAAMFAKIGAFLPANLLWTINGDGQYVTAVTQATAVNKYLMINNGDFTLNTDANANNFEENKAEGLFVDNNAGVTTTLVSDASDGKIKLVSTVGEKQTKTSIVATPSVATGLAAVIPDYDIVSSFAGDFFLGASTVSGITATNKGFVSKASANAASTVAKDAVAPDPAITHNYWNAKEVEKGGIYTFTTKEGVILAIDNVTKFKLQGTPAGFVLLGGAKYDQPVYITTTSPAALTLTSGSNTQVTFGAYQKPLLNFTAAELIAKQGTSFSLLLKDAATGNDKLTGNPFSGNLVPVSYNYVDGFFPAHSNLDSYFLMRESDGQIIVLDMNQKWSAAGIDQHVTAGGYKFTTLTQKNMAAYLSAYNSVSDRDLAFTFQIKYNASDAAANAKIQYITVTDLNDKTDSADDDVYYLASYETAGTSYLTVNTKALNTVKASFDNILVVKGGDAKNNPLLSRYVNISFVNASNVKYQTENGRLAALNGKVLGVSNYAYSLLPVESDKFLASKPEGQWAVKMGEEVDAKNQVVGPDKNSTKFIFVNRENGRKLTVDRMYSLGNDTYAVEYESLNAQFARNASGYSLLRDTLKITAAPKIAYGKAQMDGYKNLTAAELQDQQYRLSVASTSGVNYYVSENHNANHLLGMTSEVAGAVNWRLVPMTAKRTYDVNGYINTPTDSAYIMNNSQYFVAGNNNYKQDADTLAIVSYALQNTENGEYMTYEYPQTHDNLSMMCYPKPLTTANLNQAFRFILKEKQDGLFNLIGVKKISDNAYFSIDLNNKLYGATTQKGGAVEVEHAYMQINSNDLFNLTKVAAPEYRKMAMGDTIRVFRQENDMDVMYENGEFLNLGNIAQLTKMTPAMYVDTAYVNRGQNSRFQYLLVVNPTYVPEKLCTIAGHPAIHPDTTYGRFLVNAIDSAVYTYKNGAVHSNKYINTKEANETYVKLLFAWGYRTGDKLYITTDKTFSKVKNTIDLSTPDFNIAKFAFRYSNPTDATDKSFKIQTRFVDYNSAISVKDQKDRAESNEGFLKTINGVVVITNGYAKGELFNLSADKSNPTANEDLNTSAVTVIAGNGNVTILNAAGKTVVISNMLGQTIANTVLTSDNQTIAASGIVVVAVEGEEAVKAIIK